MTYWQRRLQNPLHKAYNENEQATRQWLSVYQQASKDIKAEIFDTYQKMNIEKPLISDFYRYNNLQKIEKQINDSILQLGSKEVDYTKQSLQHATLVGSQAAADVLNTNVLNKSAIDELIKRPWHDANFSDRIWKNKAQLINSLKSELTNGIIQGKSIYEVANTIDGRLDVGRSQTQRLVRTEYMHALNQGQVESYKDKGYTKLKWVATMDDRTSEVCRKRDGKTYSIDNLPDIPAHPNCRCTFVPVINTADLDKRADEIRRLKEDQSNGSKLSEKEPELVYTRDEQRIIDNYKLSGGNREEFAQMLVDDAGPLDLIVSIDHVRPRGYNLIRNLGNGELLDVEEFVLQANDNRSKAYQIKTVLHEAYHTKAYRLRTNVFRKDSDMEAWREIEETMTELSAHYQYSLLDKKKLMPAYPTELSKNLPKLKKVIPEFKDAESFLDFGKVANEYRFNRSKATADWTSISDRLDKVNINREKYLKENYLDYMKSNKEKLTDFILGNSPEFKVHRSNILSDISDYVSAVEHDRPVSGIQSFIKDSVATALFRLLGVK